MAGAIGRSASVSELTDSQRDSLRPCRLKWSVLGTYICFGSRPTLAPCTLPERENIYKDADTKNNGPQVEARYKFIIKANGVILYYSNYQLVLLGNL